MHAIRNRRRRKVEQVVLTVEDTSAQKLARTIVKNTAML
jgi:NADH/NAD ratio-sensing transcriptional regulator Rex